MTFTNYCRNFPNAFTAKQTKGGIKVTEPISDVATRGRTAIKENFDGGHVPVQGQWLKKRVWVPVGVFSFKKSTAGAFSVPLALPKNR